MHIEQLEAELLDAPEEYPLARDYSGNTFYGTIDGKDYALNFYNKLSDFDGISVYLMGPYEDDIYISKDHLLMI